MSLQNQHRPKTLDDFIGNKETKEAILSLFDRDRNLPSTFLLTGSAGTGKTTLARILVKMLGISDDDFTEMNASSARGIDNMRQLEGDLKYAPLHGKKKFILFDEAHMITKPAQEALLKILEEPPSYVHIAICTTNPEALKPTFKRRCHHYHLKSLNYHESAKLLKQILHKEGIPIAKFKSSVAKALIQYADGSAGQLLKLLDMVIDIRSTDAAINTIKSVGFMSGDKQVIDICKLLVDYKVNDATRWKRLAEVLKNFETDGESCRRQILGYLSATLLSTGDTAIALRMESFKEPWYDTGKSGLVLSCFEACNIDL